jgi:hypothetical protein
MATLEKHLDKTFQGFSKQTFFLQLLKAQWMGKTHVLGKLK